MNAFQLHPTMLLGVAAPVTAASGWALPPVDTAPLLRRLGVRTAVVEARWNQLEPADGRTDTAALESLRERLLRLRALGVEPVLSLYRGEDPPWFLERGGWEEEDNLRCYLRYVGRLLRAVGHLAAEYVTFACANVYAWEGGGAGREGRSFYRSVLVMSHIASAHIRAYRLIHDARTRLGFTDTAVGFGLRMRAASQSGGFRLRPVATLDPIYQLLPLRAMAKGEFAPPLKNVLRVSPGSWCDFVGLCVGAETGRRTNKEQPRLDDMGRQLRPETAAECCETILRTVQIPIYVFEQGVCDWDDLFRARYIHDSLAALWASHLPVPRYYYCALLDDTRPTDGILARRGLAYTELITGQAVLKRSGAFYAAVVKGQGVTEELYQLYVAGQEYKH